MNIESEEEKLSIGESVILGLGCGLALCLLLVVPLLLLILLYEVLVYFGVIAVTMDILMWVFIITVVITIPVVYCADRY